ncbi:pyrimidine dimer DNA glycosylase/endonuclease V [Cryobacterium sp. BB307]|uniref:pyrimidine dimer DNA glycosylase/endonuclease V n=1 Tax=Cryobacterium sp. BB307 TaxID=2716317 RepID=UPI0014470D00|nr:pyrimidine dimer DNA glycosylase/endonuclease V [Cryobacterium sp. BB307]
MRLWSLHPRYLDRQGLTACWREGLLAQAVIGRTSGGYSNHPQLQRFRGSDDPLASIGSYLHGIVDEADARGYRFARDKIQRPGNVSGLPVTDGQLDYEWHWLGAKLASRNPSWKHRLSHVETPDAHPLFVVIPGPVEAWERVER